jgi:hypothetical protein
VKRSQLVFVTVVFTAFLTAILVGRPDDDPFAEFSFTTPRRIQVDSLEIPTGEHRLTGVVHDAEGMPGRGARVVLVKREVTAGSVERMRWTSVEVDGTFDIGGIPEGHYAVLLSRPDLPNTLRTISIPAESEVAWVLEAPLPPIPTLPELRRKDLVGQLSAPVGSSGPPASLEGYEVVLDPGELPDLPTGATQRRVRTDAEGCFELPDLVEATYRVQVLPPWAAGGSWPVLDELPLAFLADAALEVSLKVRLRTGEFTGRILDLEGRAIEGALIRVWPEGMEQRLWPPTLTDAEGTFLVRDLPAGRFTIRVRAGSGTAERVGTVRIGVREVIPFEALAAYGER